RGGLEWDRFYLDVYDRARGSKRTISQTRDLSVSDYTLYDGKTVYFTATEKGSDNLYSVDVAGGVPKEVLHGGAIGSPTVGAGRLVFSKSSMTSPADVWSLAVGSDRPIRRTHANDEWLKAVAFNPPESRTVTGAGGASVQYWVIKPPNFDASKKYPIVFLIHGGPQGDWGDGWSSRWNYSMWAAQGWVIVAPNPRGS